MPITVKINNFETVNPGLYTATVTSLGEGYYPAFGVTEAERASLKELEEGSREFNAAVASKKLSRKVIIDWTTEEQDSAGEFIVLKQFATASLNSKATLFKVVNALLKPGENLADVAVDLDVLIGRKARIYVNLDEEKNRNSIADVTRIPAKKAAPAVKPTPAPAATITDDDVPF